MPPAALSPPIRLRGLRPGDVAAVTAQLTGPLTALYPDGATWLPARLHQAVLAPAGATAPGSAGTPVEATVAVDQTGTPVALALAQLKDRGVKLSCLWVAPHLRGHGLGTALVDRMVTAFGARTLYLTVDTSLLPDLTAVLAPFGFTVQDHLPGRYRPDAVEHVLVRPPVTDPVIKALSLTRPWGELIAAGAKNIENRSRRTGHRGVLVLHAAQSSTTLAEDFTSQHRLPRPPAVTDCATGYLGFAHLVATDCHHDDCAGACSPWAMAGSWHWRVAFPTWFPAPIPGPGALTPWTPPDQVLELVRARLR